MAELSASAAAAKKALAEKAPPPKTLTDDDFLSTGVTPLNLALSGKTRRAFQKGSVYRLIGKSRSGKTMVSHNVLCEAAINPAFKDYELIHNDIEVGARMDVGVFWPPLKGRLRGPKYDRKGAVVKPRNLQEFYETTLDRLKAGKKFVEVVDSLDALADHTGEDKMSDHRAKRNSQELRKLIPGLEGTGSILIFVQHAKVNLGASFAENVTTGGDSPLFYSTSDIWLGRRETLKMSYKGQDLPVGELIEAHVVKNRTGGRDRKVYFSIYNDYGIDDTDSCVRYLLQFGHWGKPPKGKDEESDDEEYEEAGPKRGDGKIYAPEFMNFVGKRRDLVKAIEEKSWQQHLRVLTRTVWDKVQAAVSQNRKPRYGP